MADLNRTHSTVSAAHNDGYGRLEIHDNPDVFDDEYAEDDPFITDGLARRVGVGSLYPNRFGATQSTIPSGPRRSFSPIRSATDWEHNTSQDIQPNEMGGAHIPRDPFASPDDDSSSLQRTPSRFSQVTVSDTATLQNRSLSHASSFSIAGSQSDLQGITGPSHPYAMYSQGVNVGRTPSVATSSTLHAPSRASSGNQGPASAYRTYAHNVVTEAQNGSSQSTRALIPLQMGFQDRRQHYHRRIGPDGEEQDIIGPDGHTEQLPPYSRYPDEGASKTPILGTAQDTPTENAPSEDTQEQATQQEPLLPVSAHLGPRASPEEPPGLRSASTGETVATTLSGISEKSKLSGKSWKERRRTKRFWLAVLGATMVIILAVVLGGVVGGLLVKNHQARETASATSSSVATTTVTSAYDASIISTPPSMTPVPTGSFQVSIHTFSNETRSGCLINQALAGSWTCNLPDPPLNLILTYNSPSLTPSISISGGLQVPVPVQYGSQPPSISVADLKFVMDLDAKRMGPALFFRSTYDKIAVISNESISAPPTKRLSRRHNAQLRPGDQPWFCFWNKTVIEGYIYLDKNISALKAPAPSPSIQPPPASTFAPSTIPTSFALGPTTLSLPAFPTVPSNIPMNIPSSNSMFSNIYNPNQAISSYNSRFPSNSYSVRAAELYRPPPYDVPKPPGPPRHQAVWPNSNQPPTYPLIIKIEEHRLPTGAPAPYCQQMKILYDGSFNPALDADNDVVPTVTLAESFPPPPPSPYPGSDDSFGRVRRGEMGGDCHCQWVSD